MNTLTHREHTPRAVGSHLCCSARWAVGVQYLAQGHFSRGIEDGESAGHSLPLHLQFLPAQDSNKQPLDYESNSLTIRPWLLMSIVNLQCPESLIIKTKTFFKGLQCKIILLCRLHEYKKVIHVIMIVIACIRISLRICSRMSRSVCSLETRSVCAP